MLDWLYLQHYGIKGQKWGERRFQNEDGSYTEEGKDRYGVGLKKAKQFLDNALTEYKNHTGATEDHEFLRKKADFAKDNLKDEKIKNRLNKENQIGKRRKSLIDLYKKQGMSDEDAAIAVYKRERTEKVLAISGAVAVTALGAYLAYRHWDHGADRLIKQGVTLQNISANVNKGTKDAFYASYKDKDKSKYVGLYGGGQLRQQGNKSIYKMTADVADKMKIAGGNTGRNILNDALKNDPNFRKTLIESAKESEKYFGLKSLPIEKIRSGKPLTRREYEAFNTHLAVHDPLHQRTADKFYDLLKKKGYDGVLDANDKWYSGYKSKSPAIIFDDSKLMNRTVSNISTATLDNLFKKESRKVIARQIIEGLFGAKSTAVFGAQIGAIKISKFIGKQNAQKRMIRQYKKEHPNTQLSDRNILKNIYGYS